METPRQRRSSGRSCIFSLIAICLVIGVGIVGYNLVQSQFQTSSAPACSTNKLVLTMYYAINGINADGSTLLFDTIAEQVKALNNLPTHNIKAVVVLTDGQDTASQLSIDALVSQITPAGEDAGNGIKVFTIAYGSDADVDGLTKIANATGGQEYAGTPQNIRQVYIQISEFF